MAARIEQVFTRCGHTTASSAGFVVRLANARVAARSLPIASRATWARSRSALLAASVACPAFASGPGSEKSGDAKGSSETEVVVRGPPRHPDRAPKDPAVSSSIVTPERLVAPGVRAADVLREEAGVQITEAGGLGAPATASLRGATAEETPVYIGGVRVNDPVGGVADLGTIPLFLINRIEVYRGNAPLEADELGVGGAIFFEPRRPDAIGAGLGALAGSYGTRAGWAYAATERDGASMLVGVRADASDNDYEFFDDRGTLFVPGDGSVRPRSNADASLLDVWLLGSSRAGDGSVDVLVNHVEREQGVPKLALVPSRAARAAFERSLGAVKARAPLDGFGGSVEAQTSLIIARSTFDDPLYELALNAQRVETRAERLGQRVLLRWASNDSIVVRPVADVAVERLRRFDGPTPDERAVPSLVAHRVSARVGAAADLLVAGPLSLRPLFSFECEQTSTSIAHAGCRDAWPTGRLAGLLNFGEFNAYVSGGRYVRAPTLGELYGMSLVVRGNDRLRPEMGWNAEGGVRWVRRSAGQIRPTFIDLAAFSRWATDLVSFVRSSEGYVEPQNGITARVRGVELDGGVGFLSHLAARLSVTALDPRDTSPNRQTRNDLLPFRSRLIVSPRLDGELELDSRAVRNLSFALVYVYESSRFADAAGLAVVPAQESLDAEVGSGLLDQHLTVRMRIANVLNARRFDVVGFPLPGRSAFFSMEATW